MVKVSGNRKIGFLVETDSVIELAEWAEKESKPYANSSRKSASHNWDLNAGYSGMMELVKKGWHVGTEEMMAKLDQVKHQVELTASGYRPEVTGLFFDIGRVLTGEPECWFEEDQEEKRRVVKIAVNTFAVHSTPGDLIKNRGASILALIEKLQDEKFILELEVVNYCGGTGDAKSVTTKINFQSDPIDIDAISFCLAHPAFSRRLGFSIQEAVIKGDCGGYGRGGESNYTDETADVCLGEALWVGHGETDQFKTIESAAHWVNTEAARLFKGDD